MDAALNSPSISSPSSHKLLHTKSMHDNGMTDSPPHGCPLRLPICIHCSHPASTLYRRYTASLIVLVRCGNPECGRVVDSYADEEWRRPAVKRSSGSRREKGQETEVEESGDGGGDGKAWGSLGISWMDVILVKPRAYRHFLYNIPFLLPPPRHPARNTNTSAQHDEAAEDADDDWSSWKTAAKRFVALSLVDAYLRWFYLCAYPAAPVRGLDEGTEVAWWTLPALVRKAASLLQAQPPSSAPSSILSLAFWRPHRQSDYKSSLSSFLPPDVASNVDADGTQGMVMSYLMVWVATAAELLAFHATVTAGSMAWVQWQRARRGREQGLQQRQEMLLGQGELEETEKQVDDGSDDDASSSFSEASSASTSSTGSNSGPIDQPPPHVTLLDLYRPQLISTALLLSSLSTLLLLSIVLLWESKLPRPGGADGAGEDHRHRHRSSTSAGGPTTIGDLLPTLLLSSPLFTTYLPTPLRTTLTSLPLPHLSTDFAVRTLLGGLSAGVCLAVVHPREPLLTTSLLLVGWTVASGGLRGRWTLLPGEAGPGGAGAAGEGVGVSWELGRARGLYCAL